MTEKFRLNDILMILPRRTILKAEPLKDTWSLDKDSAGLSLYIDSVPVGYACWQSALDFGIERPAITFACSDEENKLAAFEALVSRIAIAFDQMPGRYPLYIRLHSSQLDLIAKASQMGLQPYFGRWSMMDGEESEHSWQLITDSLRQSYPNGLHS